MRLLFDQNISYRVLNLLQIDYPLAQHVKHLEMHHFTDRQIWKYASENSFHIVTFDADFFDFVTLFGHPPKVVWLRCGNTTTNHIATLLKHHKSTLEKFLLDSDYAHVGCLEIDH